MEPQKINNFTKIDRYEKVNYKMLWPLMLLAIVPIIVVGKIFDTGLGHYYWYTESVKADLFLFYKMWAVICIGAISFVKWIAYLIGEKNNKRNVYHYGKKIDTEKRKELIQWLPLIIYLGFSFVSTMASKNASMGFWGGVDMFESIFTVLAYGMIGFYAYKFVCNQREVLLLFRCQAISSGIVGILYILEYFGIDFLKSFLVDGIVKIIYGSSYNVEVDSGMYATTLYNPNYVGVFCLVMIPIFAVLIFKEYNRIWKVIFGIDLILLFVSLIICRSLTGLIILVLLGTLVVIFNIKPIIRNRKATVGIIGFIILITVGMLLYQNGYYYKKIISNLKIDKQDISYDQDVVTASNYAAFRFGEHWLYVTLHEEANNYQQLLEVKNENGDFVETLVNSDGEFSFVDKSYSDVSIKIGRVLNDRIGFLINDGTKEYAFVVINGGYYYYYGENQFTSIDTTKVERAKFLDGYEKFASYRGYIWARTLPLLKKTVFLGTGRDSFIVEFPNNDLYGLRAVGLTGMNVSRPHSIYLQIMVQDGILAAICWLMVFVVYIIRYWKRQKENKDLLWMGLFLSVLGFLLMGLTNDSLVTTSPILWLILGLGIRGNQIMEETK